MRCPVPPIIVDWEDDGGFSIKDFIVKNYTGNKTEFGLRGTNERHYYNENINRAGEAPRNFEYRANFSDIASVEVGNDEIRIDPDESKNLVHSVVVINCNSNRKCIQHSLTARECSMHALISGECDGLPAVHHQNMLSKMTVDLCDAQTASNVKAALEQMIALNRKDGVAGPVDPKRMAAPGPDKSMFYVLQTVSGGVLNMRSGPGTRHRLIVGIPAGTGNLAVGACRRADTGHGKPWCRASWRGHAGWISSCCIANDKTGLARRIAH
jgi:hypothetical protein